MSNQNNTLVLQLAAGVMEQWGIRVVRRDMHRGEWDVVSVKTGRIYSASTLVGVVIAMRISENDGTYTGEDEP